METLIHAGLLNALFAALLAVMVAGLAMLCRGRPALVHALWVLVLIKFLVPSVYPVKIPCWRRSAPQPDARDLVAAEKNLATARLLSDELPSPNKDASPEPLIVEPDIGAATDPERTVKPLLVGGGATIGEGAAIEEFQPPDLHNLTPATAESTITPHPFAAPACWSWDQLIGMIWLTGSLTWLAVAAIRIIRFQRILNLAKPAPPEIQLRVRSLA